MNTSRMPVLLALCAATFFAGVSAPALANVPLAEKPLYLGETVKPAFIMAVDDSGSMQWDVLSPNQDGELVWGRDSTTTAFGFFRENGSFRPDNGGVDLSGNFLQLFPFDNRGTPRNTVPPFPAFGFARSPQFNAAYFDPAAQYLPWQNYDGTSYPSMSTATQWQSMKLSPDTTEARRYNLTATIYDQSNDTAGGTIQIVNGAPLYNGYVLKAGWSIRSEDNTTRTCPATPSNITVPASGSTALVLTADRTITGECTGGSGNADDEVDVWIPNLVDTPIPDGQGELFNVRPGMVIPSGIQYFVRQRCGGTTTTDSLGATSAQLGVWTTTTANITLPAFTLPSGGTHANYAVRYCDQNGGNVGDPGNVNQNANYGDGAEDFTVGFAYFAPTYYLTTNTSADGNTAPVAFTNLAGGPRANTTPGGGTLYRYEIRPANYATTAAYNAAMTNFANWFLYYRTRNLAMIAALTRSLNDVDFMRIGYFRINQTYNGTDYTATVPPLVMHEMSDFTNSTTVAGRRSLYAQMLTLPANGSTPNGWAVNQLGLQFQRTTGTASPASDPPVISACQFNAGMLFTDGYSNQGRPTSAGNIDNGTPFAAAPFTDGHSNTMADIASYYYRENLRPDVTAGLVPVVPGCTTSTPDLRLDCNRNQHMNFYGITLGASGVSFGVTHQQDPDTLDITPDIFVAGNAPAWPAWANDARSAVDDIWHATVNTRGQFVNATSPERISQAMNSIIQSINTAARRSAGTAASGARRAVGFTAYVPEFDPNSWTGDVKGYRLLPSGQLGPVTWSAVEELPVPALRNILVSLPNGTVPPITFSLSDFNNTNLGTTDLQRQTRLGLLATQFATGGEFAGRTVQQAIDYLRGDLTHEGSAPGSFRSRLLRNPDGTSQHRPIGDILGSQPEILNRGSEGYSQLPVSKGGRVNTDGTLVPATTTGTYSRFVNTTKATRTPVLIVGSNDGMIHGFDASTGSSGSPGEELFAVIPNSVLAKTGKLLERDYLHTFLVDGTPQVGDACIGSGSGGADCSWKTVAVMGMGAGGRSVVALDVTNPAAGFGSTNFLWEFSNLQDSDMGFTINRPRIFAGEDGVWYAAFGNGLNSANHLAKLFILNLSTGALVREITLGTVGSALDPNGAIAVLAVDGDGNADRTGLPNEESNTYTDTLYVTDFHGRLFKVDVSATSPSSWAVAYGGLPLYTPEAVDTAERVDKRQFVTGALDVTRHPLNGNMVVYGTGRYVANGDQNVISVPQVQTFYAIWDDPTQTAGFSARAALQAQTVTGSIVVDGVTRRQTSDTPVNYRGTGAKRGWYIDLYQASGTGTFRNGERVVGTPTIFGGNVVFTAFQPIGTQCSPGGKNWLYSLNVLTGASGLVFDGCTRCGGTDLNPGGTSAAPSQDPPIVVDPGVPTPQDTDGDGDIDEDDDNDPRDPNCIAGQPGCPTELPVDENNALGGRLCRSNVSVLLPDAGLTPFTQITCGRSAWRQVQ
ncbi:MAG: pilus assembly protein [Pseudomarimonas sp.]